MEKEQTALAKVEQFAVIRMNAEELAETMSENLAGESISAFDLDRIHVPAGGGTTWEIPSLDGAAEEKKELEGIIIFMQTTRAYWQESFSGEGTPPDCSSADGKVGTGDPGGACANCPNNQFQSGANGRGKSCKECRIVFVLLADNLLPVVLAVPPSSLKAIKKHMLRLSTKNLPYWKTVTRFALNKTKNADGIAYSEIVPAMAGQIPCDKAAGIKVYRDSIIPTLRRAGAEMAASVVAEDTDEVPF